MTCCSSTASTTSSVTAASSACRPTVTRPGTSRCACGSTAATVVLTGDACYLRRTLEELHLPSVVYDEEGMRQSLQRLRALRDAGARIFYGHDPEFWATVPQAPRGDWGTVTRVISNQVDQ